MASRGVNKVILIGNLGQDPDVRTMNNGEQVANFSLATSETWQDKNTGEAREKTEWHRCVAYRRLAEIIGQYVKKGSKIYVEGRLQTRKWQGQDGQDRYTTEIIVNEMQMLDSRSGGSSNYDQTPQGNYGNQQGGGYNQRPQNNQRPMPQQPVPPKQQNYGPDPDASFDDDEMPF